MNTKKTILIAGAGPAGLTAAYELSQTGQFNIVVIEKLDIAGGLSRTVNYKGNRIDIGGHRFFSKSDKVLEWWLKILPLEESADEINIHYQNKTQTIIPVQSNGKDEEGERMLIRNRKSRIYFLKKLFQYPISFSLSTLTKLGLFRSLKILFSYAYIRIVPVKPETSLKDFIINRFGHELYKTFFEDYTKKVWGIEPDKIPASWGQQRIKGVSIKKIISNALKRKKDHSFKQKGTETSLIEKFLYPQYGPGQLWEKVADKIKANGGTIFYNHEVSYVNHEQNKIRSITIKKKDSNEHQLIEVDFFISTLPVKDLFNGMRPAPPPSHITIANGLEYRDFISVGLLVNKIKLKEKDGSLIKDNWIYIQEKNVKLGRLQLFNNWSPYMVRDESSVWLGLEYFCKEGDAVWELPEADMLLLAKKELIEIGIIDADAVLDGTVIKVEKAYPGYFGSYDKIDTLINYTNSFENLFLAGRNGMHRYNNQDHSMLTAMEIAGKICSGNTDKTSIWSINTEDDYHEETSGSKE